MRCVAFVVAVCAALAISASFAPEHSTAHAFNEPAFRDAVDRALKTVKKVLDTTRNPVMAAPEVAHQYTDKYVLAEFTTNTAIAAQLNVLESLGLTDQGLQRLVQFVEQHRTVTLRLSAEERCKHVRTTTREVESPTARVVSYMGFEKRETVVTKVTEYFWQFDATYEITAFRGTGVGTIVGAASGRSESSADAGSGSVVLQRRSSSIELKTLSEQPPRQKVLVRPPIDVDLTWFLQHVTVSDRSPRRTHFTINRADDKQCHTPRRNPQTDGAINAFSALARWSASVREYFLQTLLPTQPTIDHGLDLSAASDDSTLFVPVAPLFEATAASTKAQSAARDEAKAAGDSGKAQAQAQGKVKGTGVVPVGLVNKFLGEQALALRYKREALASAFPTGNSERLVTFSEAWLLLLLKHWGEICRSAINSVDYIEAMLYAQLRSAIGKDLQPLDFQHYARFHMRKLYREEYQPRPFSYAVRRPAFDPEGVVSIEAQWDDGSLADPIHTVVSSAHVASRNDGNTTLAAQNVAAPMYFSLDASRRVAFGGERHVHGWINQQFSGSSGLRLQLVARARQFSSFILMVGRISGASTFEPKHALIIQNKDDLRLPLLLETIPTPKEFRDAIESLSPEQQRFAKGYRAMQLESTLFAVCIVQIKPALEKVLNLPDDALTKEIELTQDLLQLFIEYQIPSDLLSYSEKLSGSGAGGSGSGGASAAERVNVVRGYVAKMKEMTNKNKMASLSESAMGATHQVLESYRAGGSVKLAPAAAAAAYEYADRGTLRMMHAERLAAMPTAAAPPPPPPSPQQNARQQPQQSQQSQESQQSSQQRGDETGSAGTAVIGVDYTEIPTRLERAYERLDTDGALRPTIVNTAKEWSKTSLKSLLAAPTTAVVDVAAQGKERSRAFDLIDALTKSGDLTLDHAALHVFIAATHCFDKTLVDTVVQQNVNPIERVERSSLIVASTIHGLEPKQLVQPSQLPRLALYSPNLIPNEAVSAASTDGVLTAAATQKVPAHTKANTNAEQRSESTGEQSDDNLLPLPL